MTKKNKNHKTAAAPIGVLLKKYSREAIKDAMGSLAPLAIRYTPEDYKVLREMLDNLDWHAISTRSEMTILRNIYKATEEDDPYIFMHEKRWGISTGRAYALMYETPLKEIPLYINKETINIIAKWRLTINK